MHPENPGINVAVRWRLDGNVVHAHLEAAWQLIVARHTTLRTSFTTVDGEPYQRVAASVPFRVPTVDLTTLPEDAAAAEAEHIASIEARTTFDITVAPLLRVTLVRVSRQRSIVLVTAHHIVCDGWSIGVLAREMGEAYVHVSTGRTAALPELPHTYADYVAWEADDAQAPDAQAGLLDALRAGLQGFEPFEIVPDLPRPPVQSANGEIVSILIDRPVTNALTSAAHASGATLFMAAYAVLLVTLARSSGRSDISIGTQIAGREEVDFEQLVGTFVNTVVLRADLAGDPTFDELLEIARDVVSDAFDMRHVPIEELVKIVNPRRDLSRNALFSVNFIYQRSFVENNTFGSFTLTDLPSTSAGPICDLNFFMVERPDGWRVSCEYNVDLYRRETVEAMLRRFVRLMQTLTASPDVSIWRVPVMTGEERASVIARSTGPVTAYGRDSSVQDMFTRCAMLRPGSVAVVDGAGTLTYGELEAASNRLARHLEQIGIGPGQAVGVALARSRSIPVALLAILKTGAAYVPLDPSYPDERIAFMLRDAKVDAVVTEPGVRERLPANELPTVDLAADAAAIDAHDAAPIAASANAPERAYVMYTSGSTGVPKGVAVTHRAILRLVRKTNYVDIGPDDIVLHYAPLAFDASTFEIWAPLLNGGRLAIAPAGPLTLAELDRTLQRFRVTTLWLTAGLFREAVDARLRAFASLRQLLTGGDVVSPSHAKRFLASYPSVTLINGYGPTENTTFSCCYRVAESADIETNVPIGVPIANTTAFVVDAHGQLVPAGVVGELYVGGDGLATEYIGRPELTAERFVSDVLDVPGRFYRTGDQVRQRDDGVIEFLGRIDGQVKIRGFRVELGEIEAALRTHPAVADAAALVRELRPGDRTLVAYVIPRAAAAEALDVATVRAWLSDRLPAFAVPSTIASVDAFPLTPNGKVDVRALTTGSVEALAPAPPAQTATEERLVAILRDILGLDAIDRNADLFALDLHSMLALRFVARVQAEFGVELPLRTLYEDPTVRAIAAVLTASLPLEPPAQTPIVSYNVDGTQPPLIFFHGDLFAEGLYARRLASALGPDQPVHAVAPHGTAGLPLLDDVEAMGADYAALIREVQPHGPYRLGGYCASGLVAYEVARNLRSAGEAVDHVVLLNASPMPPARIAPIDALVRRIGSNATLAARVRDILLYNLARVHAALVSGPRGIVAFFRYFVRANEVKNIVDPLEPERPFEHRQTAYQVKASFAHVVAALTYHPRPFDGGVTLIWGEDQITMLEDPTMGWGAVARRVDVVPMHGGHVGSLSGRIRELADTLGAVLTQP